MLTPELTLQKIIFSVTIVFIFIIQSYSQEVTVSGQFSGSLESVINKINKEYNVQIFIVDNSIANIHIAFTFDQEPLQAVLQKILLNTSCILVPVQNKLFFIVSSKQVEKIMNYTYNNGLTQNINVIGTNSKVAKNSKAELKIKVLDGQTSEPVVGATIIIKNTLIGGISDGNGKVIFTLLPGKYKIASSCIGYEENSSDIQLIGNGEMKLELFSKSVKLEEVVVSAQKADRNVRNNQMSILELDKKMLKQLPSMFGEKDVVKSMTTMPGVKSVGEFGSGINVRGGNSDQNLILLENTPVLNTSHVFGLISAVNPDVVQNVTLYKGYIPEDYGERVSSVMDIQMKEGNYNNFHINGGIGILNSRLMIESPIVKNKASILIAGRSSYSDWLLKQMPDLNLRNSSANFYDANLVGSYLINEKNKIVLNVYHSGDAFKYGDIINYKYSNTLSSIIWSYKNNETLNGQTSLCASIYKIDKDKLDNKFEKSNFKASYNYFGLKTTWHWKVAPKHMLNFGIQSNVNYINPGEIKPLDEYSTVIANKLDKELGLESSFFMGDQFDLTEKLSIQPGVRFSNYMFFGSYTKYNYASNVTKSSSSIVSADTFSFGELINNYFNIEPRIALKYLTGISSSCKLSFSRNVQYVSLVSYTSISTPDDVWKSSSPYLKPITSNQVSFGYFQNLSKNTIETSCEVYFRKLNNVIEYKNGAQLVMNKHIETELINANDYNYGAEIFIKKNAGFIQGWIGYTYSRSLRKTDGIYEQEIINKNSSYPSSVDKPHDFSIFVNFQKNKRLRFSLTFNYAIGRAVTLPEATTVVANTKVVIFSDRNQYRLPDYHRLDVSISLDESLKLSRKWKGSWTLSVINVYARKNPYSVIYKKIEPTKDNGYKEYGLYKLYIIGMPLPTLTYNFIF